MEKLNTEQPIRPKHKLIFWQTLAICFIAVCAVVLYFTVEFSESSRIVSKFTKNDLIAKEHSEAVKTYLSQADFSQVPEGELAFRVYVSYKIYSDKIKNGFDITPGTEADKPLSQIWERFQKGDLQKVEQMLSGLFLSLSSSGSGNVLCLTELLGTRGDVARIMLDYELSCNIYEQALELNGNNSPEVRFYILLGLAGTYSQANQHGKALELLNEALEIQSTGVDIEKEQAIDNLAGLGYLYFRMNEYDRAEKFLNQVISESDTSSDSIKLSKANTLFYLGMISESKYHYGDAADLYKQSHQIYLSMEPVKSPDFCTVAFYLAKVYLSQEKTTDVEPLLRQALGGYLLFFDEKHPMTAQVYHYLSVLYNKTEKLEEAESCALKAINSLLKFNMKTGYEIPETTESLENYKTILIKAGLSKQQAEATINVIHEKYTGIPRYLN